MRQRVLFLFSLLLTMMVLVVIFCFSAQPVEQSREISSALTRFIARLIPWLRTGLAMSELHHLLRKLAHFTLYFLLGCGLTGMLRSGRRAIPAAFAIPLGTLCAAMDEWHQAFVPGRGPGLCDVVLDTVGVAAAAGLLSLIIFLHDMRRDSPKRRENR